MTAQVFSADQLRACKDLISPHIHQTPVLRSRLMDQRSGASLFFKCENFQKGGSYKIRGATHALLRLLEQGPVPAVVTHSSGNFAQALSLAAHNLGIPAYIVMPRTAPAVKKDAVRTYKGTISECEPTLAAREETARSLREKTGAVFIHPSDDPMVMLGQGTAAMELMEEVSGLDTIVAPVGGGGLLSGTALAVHFFGEACEAMGAEPFAVDDAYRSLKSGKIERNETTDTLADGLKTVLGQHTFPVLQQYVKTIIRVEESEIVRAMRLVWERMKIIIEPSSAVAVAAVLREPATFAGKRVGILVSGGNVDLGNLPF